MTARRLVVIGDTLLDRDVDGSVTRIAPDAPAPVLDEIAATERPGGAGLAALLATGHGYDIVLITALAADAAGARLAELLAAAGVTVYGLTCAGATGEKIRLRAGGRMLLRLDRGGPADEVPGDPGEAALAELEGAAAVLVSDYGRGVARQPVLRSALAGLSAPVVWDPHPRGPAAVPGTRLVTPNESELRGLTGIAAGGRLAAAAQGAEKLRRQWRVGAVVVTLGSDGALLSHAAPAPLVVPVPTAVSGDTCGAGDRFATAATLALAGGALVSEAVQEAVIQAAAYVAAGAVAAVRGPVGPIPAPAGPAAGETVGAAPVETDGAGPGGGVFTLPRRGNGSNGKSTNGYGRRATVTVLHEAAAADGAVIDGTSSVAAAVDGTASAGPASGHPGLAGAASPVGAGGAAGGGGAPSAPGVLSAGGPPGADLAGALVARVRARGGTVVASGGCFDLLHAGHVATLEAARKLGDCLVVCLNSDSSVRSLKGPERPVINQADRARLLSALACVDAVVVFDETTPHAVLSWLRPDIWVKGGDYSGGAEDAPDLPEAELVARWGGQTVVVPYLDGRSTTGMIAAARAGGTPKGAL